jgi:hypothetical protein
MRIRFLILFYPYLDSDLCRSRSGFFIDADPDQDPTFHPKEDPELDPDPRIQIKSQTLEKVLK